MQPPPNRSQHISTMNFWSLIDSGQLKPVSDPLIQEKVWIVDVDPTLAKCFLEFNFADNRSFSQDYVNKLCAEMKAGRWGLSNDAITVDSEGRFLNAQHRMRAVIASETTQRFILLFGVEKESAQWLDIGKKRSMSQRITVSGVRMSEKECSVIRNAMNDYSKTYVGTVQYSERKDDELVKEVYQKHHTVLRALKGHQQKGPGFYWAAALKMHAEMLHYGHEHNFSHNMSPLERAKLWIDLVNFGYSREGLSVGPEEVSAIKLRNMRENRSANDKGMYWSHKEDLKYTICAAYKFMRGDEIQSLTKYKADPFHNFIDMPDCNFE